MARRRGVPHAGAPVRRGQRLYRGLPGSYPTVPDLGPVGAQVRAKSGSIRRVSESLRCSVYAVRRTSSVGKRGHTRPDRREPTRSGSVQVRGCSQARTSAWWIELVISTSSPSMFTGRADAAATRKHAETARRSIAGLLQLNYPALGLPGR